MRTLLYVLMMFVLVGTKTNASPFKEGDGFVIDSEHIPNNRILQQEETQLSDNRLKDDDCNDGDRKPSTESCRHYYECKNKKYEDESCWWPWKFDSVSLECVFWGAKCAEPNPSPTDPTPTKATDSTPTKATDLIPTKPGPEPTQPPCYITTGNTNETPTKSSTDPSPDDKPTEPNTSETTTESSVGHNLPSYFITFFIGLLTIYFQD